VDLGREALSTAMVVGAPVLLVGVVVGLLIGLVQALTQIQDQTVSFVPKLVMMGLVLVLCLPWLIQRMVTYSEDLITNIPRTLLGG
jgi:flagellar biosynthetic protein FliQ